MSVNGKSFFNNFMWAIISSIVTAVITFIIMNANVTRQNKEAIIEIKSDVNHIREEITKLNGYISINSSELTQIKINLVRIEERLPK